MGLQRNPDLVRVGNDDPKPWYIGSKIVPGSGTAITKKNDNEFGHQLVISSLSGDDKDMGSRKVLETSQSTKLKSDVYMAIINAADRHVEIELPHPAEVLGWLVLICVDNSQGVTLRPEDGTGIFDASNMDFNTSGDALILASNRKDTWYCISRYTAYFPYS